MKKTKIAQNILLLFSNLLALCLCVNLQAQTFLPPLSLLEKAALQHAGLSPRRLQDWQKRSRWAAALPRVQVAWENSLSFRNSNTLEDNLSVTSAGITIGPESSQVDQDWNDEQDFSVRAIWSLDELLFNRDEMAVAREARDQYFVRKRLLEEVQHHYFTLKGLLLQQQVDRYLQKDPLHRLRIERHYQALNSLSGQALEQNQRKHASPSSHQNKQQGKNHDHQQQKAFADFYRSLKLPRR